MSKNTDKVYIGKTIGSVQDRFNQHLDSHKQWTAGVGRKHCSSSKIIDCGDARIEIAKELQYPEDWTKKQIDKDTRRWERSMVQCYDGLTVNSQMPLGKNAEDKWTDQNLFLRDISK